MAVKEYWRRLTILDRIIVAAMVVTCALLFAIFGLRPPGQAVQVVQEGDTVFTAPLAEKRSVELKGPLGVTRMEIENGTARIVASPCPYKVCIRMGEISRQGEIVACVPNRLLVQVAGVDPDGKERGYDLLSR